MPRPTCTAHLALLLLPVLCVSSAAAAAAVAAAAAPAPAPAASAPPPLVSTLLSSAQVAPGVYTDSYALHLPPVAPGEVTFTDPRSTVLLRPPGRVALLSYVFDLVDSTNKSVPLSQARAAQRAPP